MRAPTSRTVEQAGEALIAGIEEGTITNRSGQPDKPSTVRRYKLALAHLDKEIGHLRLADIDRGRVKGLIRFWQRAGMTPSSIRNNLDPLRVLIREAIEDGQCTVDPMARMRMPGGKGRRERVADRAEAQKVEDPQPRAKNGSRARREILFESR